MLKIKSIKNFVPLLLASTAVLTNSSVAKAVNFNFTYAPGVTMQQITAMETAGMIWSDYLADDITVNLHIETTNQLSNNVIGGALPGFMTDVKYSDFRSGLNANRVSSYDNATYNNLSLKVENGEEKFDARIDAGFNVYTEDSANLSLTRANAKVLGLVNAHNTQLDGYILMSDLSNTSASWNYDLNNISSNKLDYLSVAVHEIGHNLGFVSGVDLMNIDNYADLNALIADYGSEPAFADYMDEVIERATPMDMYRYSAESVALGNTMGNNVIDFTTSTQSYLSDNGGQTLFLKMSQGEDDNAGWGDSYQASHWKQSNNNAIGIMDPLISLGDIRQISDRDLRVMDAIGYTGTQNGYSLIAAGGSQLTAATGFGTNVGVLQSLTQAEITTQVALNGLGSLTQDRSAEVQTMLDQSMIYSGEGQIYRGRGGGWGQRAFWQTVDLDAANSQAVPEPGSTAGFLAMGVLGLTTLVKRKK